MQPTRGPNIRIPPAFFVTGFLVGLWLEVAVARIRFVDAAATPTWLVVAGWTIALLGFALSGWSMLTFRRARTTMFPFRPATTLVQHGPYRFTRNPMYVGATLSYVGIAMVINAAWPLVLLPLVLLSLSWYVVREEENYLAALFADEYHAYKKRVRRWI